jgi:hypothetical protein
MRKWLVISGVGLLVLLTFFLVRFVMLRSLTPTIVHDEELQLVRASIPDGSNAFNVLLAAGDHLWWPNNRSREFSNLAQDTNWNEVLASAIVTSNRLALADWDAAAQIPDLQVPEISTIQDQVPYLEVWKKLAQAANVRENILFHEGVRDPEAFDQIMNDVKMGNQMQKAKGDLICYYVGVSITGEGLNQLRHWVGKTHLNPGQLKDYIHQIDLVASNEDTSFADAIKAEYRKQVGSLDAWHQGKFSDPDTGSNYSGTPFSFPVLNFNRTKALFAHDADLLVKGATRHYSESPSPDLGTNQPGFVSTLLHGNLIGQLNYEMLKTGMSGSLATKSRANVRLQATRTILALRAYQLLHGNLPADLSALVPEFLDKVPIDDFDGQPLRYSRERKMVYSVATNLKDDGGDDSRGKPPHAPLDLVCRFDF